MSVDLMGPRTLVVAIESDEDSSAVLSRVERQADLAGAYSGYGSYCPEGIPAETAIFAILGAFGVAFGILFRAVTLITGRRRRRRDASIPDDPPKTVWDELSYKVADVFWWGMFSCFTSYFIWLVGNSQIVQCM
jgi:hypothetical protein